ncbi:hypothetical protein DL769_011374 [Monosporascus sp. CRB-8-3]|nr:hypothetical protein DL769_011374 [Monosporascus sp. CRB-8-3]
MPSVRTGPNQVHHDARSLAATKSIRRESKSQKRMRPQTASFEAYSRDFDVETLGNVDQQHQGMILEYHPGGLTTNMRRLVQCHQWHEFGDMMDIEGPSPNQDLDNNDDARTIATMPATGSATVSSSTTDDMDGQGFAENTIPSNIAPLPQPSTYISALRAPPLEQASDSSSSSNNNNSRIMMDRLMELNMAVPKDLQKAKEASQARGGEKSSGLGSVPVGTL